ncbi:hypothetical protein [Reichenbachiella sp.]|uniref:hypothetical protein n=1 Tax=Reichenbachiella sp. TaxID=2184521 RepID=UPI003B5A087A
MALSKDSIRAKAHDLYVYSDFNQQEICDICEISDKTLREWIKKHGWEEERKQNSITTPKIIAALNQRLYELSTEDDGKAMIANADKISKIAAAIEKLKGRELYLSNYIEVFKDITNWLFTQGDSQKMHLIDGDEVVVDGVQAAKMLNAWMKDFINVKIHGSNG